MEIKDLLSLIKRIVYEETVWLRIYKGKVADVNDPLKQARVKVTVFELGFDTPDKGFWCPPEDRNSLSLPKIGDWVKVYFENGNRNKPKFFGKANEMLNMLPKNYNKLPTTHVLFEDPDNTFNIKYDALVQILTMGTGIEAFVKGTSHKSALTSLSSTIAAVVPAGSSAANIAAIQVAFATFSSTLSSMLSTKIKGE